MVTDGAAAATYIIDFQAGSPGQTLTVTYTLDDLDWGEVTLEAAVLTPKHPSVAITQPTVGQAFTAPAMFTAAANASQVGATLDNVSLLQDGNPLLALTTPPFNFDVSGLVAGNYQFTVQAVDSNNLTQISDPVPIHVVGSGGELAATIAAPPDTVDLTQQGTADWILLGRDPNVDVDRKANVAALIHTTTEPSIGGVSLIDWAYSYYYDDNLVTYTAEDGNNQFGPVTCGIYLPNPGSGFEFAIDAGLTERTLRVYVGAYRAQGKFEAYMSDGSAPVFVDSSTDTQDHINHVYAITFRAASEGQKLIVRYTLLNNYDYGNVTLQAITLGGAPVQGELTASIATPPSSVDLTNVGTADWVLFGRYDNVGVDRKFSVKPVISPLSWINTNGPYAYHDNLVTYQAEDGTFSFSPTTSGVYIPVLGGGFEFTVDAGTAERTLNVYVGAYRAQGKLEAFLSDGTAAPLMDTSTDAQDHINQVYTIKYHAVSEGQTLTIRYTEINDYADGNVTLQAVAVDGTPIYVPGIKSVWPAAAGYEIPVYIYGEHFGSTQGNSYVSFNGTTAPVSYWSDSEVDVTVPDGARSGPLSLTVDGMPGNSVAFRVVLGNRATTQPAVILPDAMYLVPGDFRSVQLLDPQGNPVSGGTWSIGDSSIASVSTDDPPRVTAKQFGDTILNVTGSGFSASAEIHVVPAAVFETPGTISWTAYPSNNNSYFGAPIQAQRYGIGGPDLYAAEYRDDTPIIHAYTIDGHQLWQRSMSNRTAIVSLSAMNQGGVLALLLNRDTDNYSLTVWDQQGNPGWTYTGPLRGAPVIHPNGMVYIVQNSCDQVIPCAYSPILVGLDSNGQPIRQISLPASQGTFNVTSGTNPALNQCVDDPSLGLYDVSNLTGQTGLEKNEFTQPLVGPNGSLFMFVDSTISNETVTSCIHQYIPPGPNESQGFWVFRSYDEEGSYQETLSALEVREDGSTQLTTVRQFPNLSVDEFLINSQNPSPDQAQNSQNPNFQVMAKIRNFVPDNEGGAVLLWDAINPLQSNWENGSVNSHYVSRVINGTVPYTTDRQESGEDGLVTGENGIMYEWDGSKIDGLKVADGSHLWAQPAISVLSAIAGGGVEADSGNGTAASVSEQGTLNQDAQPINLSWQANHYSLDKYFDIGQTFGELSAMIGPSYIEAGAGFATTRPKKGTNAAELPLIESFAPSPIYYTTQEPAQDNKTFPSTFNSQVGKTYDLDFNPILSQNYTAPVGDRIATKFWLRDQATIENFYDVTRYGQSALAFIGHTFNGNDGQPTAFAYGLHFYYPTGGLWDDSWISNPPQPGLPGADAPPDTPFFFLPTNYAADSAETLQNLTNNDSANRNSANALNRTLSLEMDNGSLADQTPDHPSVFQYTNSPWVLYPPLWTKLRVVNATNADFGRPKLKFAAKIIFLGACGIAPPIAINNGQDSPVVQMFDLRPDQAIVGAGSATEVDLSSAVNGWAAMVKQLEGGKTIQQAVDYANSQIATQPSVGAQHYLWKIKGNGNAKIWGGTENQ